MRAERVDVANFGAFSYVLAARVADAAAIVVPTDEAGKQPHYKSTIITRPDSGIENLGDLRGKTLAFVDPTSTSGYLYPRKGLVEAGLDPDKDLGRTTFAGGHDAVALAVKNGTVDAGAVADVLHARMVRGGIISRGDTEIIWESEPIPGDPVAVRADLPPDLKRRIRDSFLSMTPEQVGGPLGITGAVGYVEVSDEDYDGIRDLVRTLDLDLDALADE
jgi:phosphonate transport system substrate-binding protein